MNNLIVKKIGNNEKKMRSYLTFKIFKLSL